MTLSPLTRYRLRLKRKRRLWDAFRSRHALMRVRDRTREIGAEDILCVMVVRNEAERLPHFLDYHRALGVGHFLVVDNDSTDGTGALLAAQTDVSLWLAKTSYKASRFGVDWTNWLLQKYGSGHWCLTLDADELFAFPHMDSQSLKGLCDHLKTQDTAAFGVVMMDLFPQTHLGQQNYAPGQNPLDVLPFIDPLPLRIQRQQPMDNLWVQGGPRDRVLFQDDPRRAPTLNKTPLVFWKRGYAYVNSTHAMLPRELNQVYNVDGQLLLSGALLHTKFLPSILERSKEERHRGEHFSNGALYDGYYEALSEGPIFWYEKARKYEGWRQLEELGFLSRGDWHLK